MLLMLGLGGGLYMMWNQLSALNAQRVTDASAQSHPVASVDQPLGPIYSLDTFIVNLADKGGTRYLRITMDLELGNSNLKSELNKRLPQVRDSLLMILPTKRFEDIRTMQGKTALRDEMLKTLNDFLAQGKITNIYFKEFVVQ